jgi:hypothetical protein
MNLQNLNLVELNAQEVQEIDGGIIFGLLCITRVADGIKGNTKFHRFQRC